MDALPQLVIHFQLVHQLFSDSESLYLGVIGRMTSVGLDPGINVLKVPIAEQDFVVHFAK